MNKLQCALLAGLCLVSFAPDTSAQSFQRKPQVIDKPEYQTDDLAVIELNILDYNASANQGNENVTELIQNALNFLGDTGHSDGATRRCGGVLYLPAGQYVIDGGIVIPKGVTIRGDWEKPVKGKAVGGTVLKITARYKGQSGGYTGPFGDTNQLNSVFRMEPATQIKDMAFWWVDQNPSNPSVYPPAVSLGRENYWGNEGCNVRNVTLVNAYEGIEVSELNGEAASMSIYDIYGTPLYRGIVIDHLQDVSRVDHVDFSPAYWAGSGLDNAGDASAWIRQNGVAFEIRRNDWSYVCNSSAEGYKWGFYAVQSHEDNHWAPNGHNYNLNFRNCGVGFYMEATNGYGLMITHSTASGCGYGVQFPAGNANAVQFLDCTFSGSKAGVRTDIGAVPVVQLEQCTVDRTDIMGGQLLADDSDLTSVHVGPLARCLMSDNRVGTLKNESVYECIENGTKDFTVKKVPRIADDVTGVHTTRPAKNTLFLVNNGRPGDYITGVGQNYSGDWTNAIQTALDNARTNGGGIVYLPAGHYRCNAPLTIPTGVELRGSADLAAFSHGQGSVLEVYCGEGAENGTPFITMEPASGMRGITLNYPNQNTSILSADKCTPKAYPYSVRGNKDVYIVNLALRGAYRGVDLFTNNCDNHYVDYISGHSFRNVVRVGGMSHDGTISNIQVNTIVFANGNEGKFGSWPNFTVTPAQHSAIYQQNADELDFFIVGDCRNENMYNNFLYGCNKGIIFQSDGQGGATFTSLGNAVDGVVNTFVMRQTFGDVDMVNTQLVALNNSHSANFFTTESGYSGTVNMYSTNNWGSGDTFARVTSGTVNFILSNLDQMGAQNSFAVTDPGRFNMINFYARTNNNSNANGNVGVYTGIYAPKGNGEQSFGAFRNILANGWSFDAAKASESFLSRNGWKAIANNDAEGDNTGAQAARNALDGDAGSRWTTGEGQNAATHWFAFFPSHDISGFPAASVRANAIVLDFMGSTGYNDAPQNYRVQLLDMAGTDDSNLDVHGNRWRTVAQGNGGSAVLALTFDEQEIHGVRIVQTGSWTNWWSLAEANLARLNLSGDDVGPEPVADFDLQPVSLCWEPGGKEIAAGTKIGKFKVIVRNNGADALADADIMVTVAVDNKIIGTAAYTDPVPSGNEFIVDVAGDCTAAAGGHTVTAAVAAVAGESDTGNNTRVRTFNARGTQTGPVEPDHVYVNDAAASSTSPFVIEQVKWFNANNADGPISPGDPIKFTAVVRNNTGARTPDIKHGIQWLWVNDGQPDYSNIIWCDTRTTGVDHGATVELTSMGAGDYAGVAGAWVAPAKGTYTVRAWFDDQHGLDNAAGRGTNMYVMDFPVTVGSVAGGLVPEYIDSPTGADGNVSTPVENVTADAGTQDVWYNLQGISIDRPSAPGIYIRNGRKVLVKD